MVLDSRPRLWKRTATGKVGSPTSSIGSVVQRQLPSPDQNANIDCMEMHASLRLFTLFHGRRAASAHCHEFLTCFLLKLMADDVTDEIPTNSIGSVVQRQLPRPT